MSYFGVLLRFVVTAIVLFFVLLKVWRTEQPRRFIALSPFGMIGLLVVIAVVYTTPWDNYLVATRVWWYDPELVTGITFGYVPLEEYTFFVLQTVMTGLLTVLLMRLNLGNMKPLQDSPNVRRNGLLIVGSLWLVSTIFLFSNIERLNYLTLELSWALLPVLLQLAFGADILWHHRRLVLTAVLVPTIYLSFVDFLAIGSGTWTISPTQSLEWLFLGVLPIEEIIFFLLTNILVVFGLTLALAEESQVRLGRIRSWWTQRKRAVESR